ncbi:hypothetical protein HY024_05350 [Candidatus Curtissbacteria bacterium]|nr:hypothetical protein [Candidatus Curtissbacteria bacterium]
MSGQDRSTGYEIEPASAVMDNAKETGLLELVRRSSWGEQVAYAHIIFTLQTLRAFDLATLPRLDIQQPQQDFRNQQAAGILLNLYEKDKELNGLRLEDPTGSLAIMGNIKTIYDYYRDQAREIRISKRYNLLGRMQDIYLKALNNEGFPQIVKELLGVEIATLHLMLGNEDEPLVGVKDGAFWAKVKLPSIDSPTELLLISMSQVATLPLIGSRELVVVPENLLRTNDLKEVSVPRPVASIEDSLEAAYYNQRFMLPLDGAEVRFRKAGDLEALTLIQVGDHILGKFAFSTGEMLGVLNINTCSFFSWQEGTIGAQLFGEVLAEVYRDMVTAVELPTTRSGHVSEASNNTNLDGPPSVIYIPRVIRDNNAGGEFRPAYMGPKRPTSPYRVRGHRRKANMSEEHRRDLISFERKHDISILENLPEGFTYVRPHVVPRDEVLVGLPVFIKRKIETQLKQDLLKPVAEDESDLGEAELQTENF